jgi:glutamate racemase
VLWTQLSIPVVGTVPAVKPAVALSASRRIAVLATAGTIRRSYTAELVERFAGDCDVRLVAAPKLAGLAEQVLRGESVPDEAFCEQSAPCFSDADGRRTDVVVLSCTHFPLVLDRLQRAAPWPVHWVDPAPAIARRAASLIDAPEGGSIRAACADDRAWFTSGRDVPADLRAALRSRGFGQIGTHRPV